MRRYSLMGKQRKITATKQRKTLMAIKTKDKPRLWAIKPIMAGPASNPKYPSVLTEAMLALKLPTVFLVVKEKSMGTVAEANKPKQKKAEKLA